MDTFGTLRPPNGSPVWEHGPAPGGNEVETVTVQASELIGDADPTDKATGIDEVPI